jgi:hypothetical protein
MATMIFPRVDEEGTARGLITVSGVRFITAGYDDPSRSLDVDMAFPQAIEADEWNAPDSFHSLQASGESIGWISANCHVESGLD